MSKAFTTEDGPPEEDDEPPEQDGLPEGFKNYMTPKGFTRLQEELRHLLSEERPRVVEIVSWAAGNGDRSENGDYLYGKKRLREIDRRIRFLNKRLEASEVVDPKKQQALKQVFFGATVTYARADDSEHVVKLVGIDEIDPAQGLISWISPLAKALMKARAGDTVNLRSPSGTEKIDVIDVRYIID
jgi:transcription elongation factor GreB